MNERHEPDPEFVASLEWQVCTASRRAERFAEPVPASRGSRWVRTPVLVAVLMAASAGLGAAGVSVAERVQVERARYLVVERARLRTAISLERIKLIKREFKRVQVLTQQGMISGEALERTRTAALLARFDALRAVRRLEEARASGREPKTDLDAPLVDGRDYVAEQVAIDLLESRARAASLGKQHVRLEKLMAAGLLSPSEGRDLWFEQLKAEAETRRHEERLGIRLSYLDGHLPLDRVLLEVLRVEALCRLEVLRARLKHADEAADHARRGFKQQIVTKKELVRLDASRAELEGEFRLAELELELIEVKLHAFGSDADAADYRERFLAVEATLLRELGLGDFVDKLNSSEQR
jgi:hypothetical protein